MACKVRIALPPEIPALWNRFLELVGDELENDLISSKEDCLKSLVFGDSFLFVAEHENVCAVAVVRVYDEKHRMAEIVILGGQDIKTWGDEMNQAITQFAKVQGCKYVITAARKGWQRIWPDFTAGKIIYHKEITHD